MSQFILFKGIDCAPCRTLEAFLNERGVGFATVVGVDNPKETVRRKVRTVPTLLLVDEEGEEIKRFVGLGQLRELDEVIKEVC